MKLFVLWCIEHDAYRLSTIRLHLAAIRAKHLDAGNPSPTGDEVWRIVRAAARKLRQHPAKKNALTPDLLLCMSQALRRSGSAIDARDRAILLLGFALGWRRSEIAALTMDNLTFTPAGVVVTLGASKTDQTGSKGRAAGICHGINEETCPVLALREWLDKRGATPGNLFIDMRWRMRASAPGLSGSAIGARVKRCLRAGGVDEEAYSAHSLRSGMITAAAYNGASLPAIMERSGHTCVQTLMGYIRKAKLFSSDPLRGVL